MISNESALIEYGKYLNHQANLRDYLMNFLNTILITNIQSIQLQSAALVQITESTNQLTRTAATLAIEKLYQLALILHSIAMNNPYEDLQIASKQILQSTSHLLTVNNSPFITKHFGLIYRQSMDHYKIE